jgi:hypothetical protein
MDRRSQAATACAPGGTAASRRGKSRTTSRADTPNPTTLPLSLFQNEFSQIFQTEVLQTLNTKVVKQVTLFNNAKGSRVFIHWFEHKVQGNLGKNSVSMNSNSIPCSEIFTPLHSKLAMPIFMKVVCLAKLHIFPIG